MALQFSCERFIEVEGLTCECAFDSLSDEDLDEILDAASDILVLISGLSFGECEHTVRPCKPNFTCGGACGCCELDAIVIPGANPEITEITIDGVTVDENTYALVVGPGGDRLLVRFKLDGKRDYWPGCQRIELPSTMTDTFEVSYTSGLLVNTLVRNATAEIACDLVMAATGNESKLPDGTIALTVYGITIDRRRAGDVEAGGPELAGLSWTQRLLGTYPRPAPTTSVWSPELPGAEWTLYSR